MAIFPITLERERYNHSQPIGAQWRVTDWNRRVEKLETALNKMVAEQPEKSRIYKYSEVATRTGLDIEFIRKVCYPIDAGSGGFTGTRSE